MQRKLSSAWSSRSSFGAFESEVEFELKVNAKLFDDHLISLRVHSASPNESLFGPQMDTFSVLKWDHFGSPNESISGLPRRPENDHFVQQVNSVHTMRDSLLKCRFRSILDHSPISLTLPLSSFGWLRNNSSSRRKRPMRASVKIRCVSKHVHCRITE